MVARIIVEGLVKRYRRFGRPIRGGSPAVDGLSFRVDPGEVVALLGPNGAGKSTTIRSLLGMIEPDEGRARVETRDGNARARVGYLPEQVRLPRWLSGQRWLVEMAHAMGQGPAEAARWVERVGLAGAKGSRIGAYSKGMRQRLALAQAFMGAPDAIFLDEPASGLDPEGRVMLRELIRSAGEQRACVILCTHDLAQAAAVASRVLVLAGGTLRGEVRSDGSAAFAQVVERSYLEWMEAGC